MKAEVPMEVSASGRSMESSAAQFRKALLSMTLTVVGKEIASKAVQSENAAAPIVVPQEVMVIDCKLVQFTKAELRISPPVTVTERKVSGM